MTAGEDPSPASLRRLLGPNFCSPFKHGHFWSVKFLGCNPPEKSQEELSSCGGNLTTLIVVGTFWRFLIRTGAIPKRKLLVQLSLFC